MAKFSAMIPESLRMDLEYLAARHDTTISILVRVFLQKCVDEAFEKEAENEK